MGEGGNARMSKSWSWPRAKTAVKRWLNLRNASESRSDYGIINESVGGGWRSEPRRKSCSDRDNRDLSGGWLVESSEETRPLAPQQWYGSPAPPSSWRPPRELRVFVGTWNVGGRAPHGGLDLSDWLMDGSDSSPHIYVLGKVIWLGDLNYRLTTSGDTRELLERSDWPALLERDQLRAEQRAGRVFAGWEEGRIRFPPTYKYLAESDAYAMMSLSASASSRQKKRAPAWCDRILWRGDGMEQLWYTRGESRFSDHRPVSSLFSARLDDAKKRNVPAAAAAAAVTARLQLQQGRDTTTAAVRCAAAAVVEAEEMLVVSRSRTAACVGGPHYSARF